MKSETEQAECDQLREATARVAAALHQFLKFEQGDAQHRRSEWCRALQQDLPIEGAGHAATLELLCRQIIPNGLPMAHPGCSAYIMTAPTTVALMARLAAALASPQRYGQTAFQLLEVQALCWLKQLFGLPDSMQGVFTAGGTAANLIALASARQSAYRALGIDAASQGTLRPGRILASTETHHSVQKSAAILGLGREAVQTLPCDARGRISIPALAKALSESAADGIANIAIVANAGATSTGVIDPIAEVAALAQEYGIWLHVDGAYGLPGMLDERYSEAFEGLNAADSVSVDPHKWFGTTIGVGAVFVRDRQLLLDSFCQGESNYLQSAWSEEPTDHSLLDFGEPFGDMGIDLSAPARGVEVWAVLKEIGREGLRARICRHNSMAIRLAECVAEHPHLELLAGPNLSICCFRYSHPAIEDLDGFNRELHRLLVSRGNNMPSTTVVNGHFALRPCFLSARADIQQVDHLLADVLEIGDQLRLADF